MAEPLELPDDPVRFGETLEAVEIE